MSRRDAIAEIQQSLSLLVRGVQRIELHEHVGALSGENLGPPQYSLLTRIVKGEPRILNELAAELGRDQSTLSRQVKEMERDGLVARQPKPGDGRSALLVATDRGRETFSLLLNSWLDVIDRVVADVDDDTVEAFAEQLSSFAHALSDFVTELRDQQLGATPP